MKAERIFMVAVNLLLAAIFAAAILIFVEQAGNRTWEWYSCVKRSWPVLICFAAGLVGRRIKSLRTALFPIALAAAGALIWLLFPWRDVGHSVYIGFAVIVGAVLYLIGLRGSEAYPPKLALTGVGLYLALIVYAVTGKGLEGEALGTLSVLALLSFIMTMYSLNAASLYTGVHNAKGGKVMSVPSGLRGKNLLFLTAFLACALLIAGIGPLRDLVAAGIGAISAGIKAIIRWIASSKKETVVPIVTPTPSPEPEEMMLPDIEGISPLYATIFIAVLVALSVILVLIIALSGSGNKKRGSGGKKKTLRDLLRKLFRQKEVLEYEDRVERLTDLRGLLKRRRKELADFFERMGKRPERFDDMPTNIMRLRFAYRQLLRSPAGKRARRSTTPLELRETLGGSETLRRLTGDYSAARYNPGKEPGDEEAENARRALSDMRRRGARGGT
ncbi:MAG: DUF4129 domain-containing protein [Clostridiales bacterium]|nr:DUF4129 domain-containing protein [Clostridiales bacterium]